MENPAAQGQTPQRHKRRKVLPRMEEGLRELADEARAVLSRISSEMDGEYTAADYARLGSLWVRLAEAALKCEQHRAAEAERKAKAARVREADMGNGVPGDQLSEQEKQLNLF